MTTVAGPARRWRVQLWVLGACMVGLGVAMGVAFPFFLVAMKIATPAGAAAWSTRGGCLAAGITVAGIDYLLARLVLGGRLRQSEERYRSLIDGSSDLVLVTDRAGLACFLSPSATRLLASREPQEPGNRDCVDLVLAVDEPDRAMLAAALGAALPGQESSVEVHLTTPSLTHTFDVSIQDLTRCAPVGGLVLTAHDVTDQRALQREIEYRALHDSLTGLPNRVLLADRCSTALRKDVHARTRTGLLLIDLDRFKEINDTFGHHVGDELLTQIGRRLAGLVRDVDTVARLGGDEFAVLLPGVGTLADVLACAGTVRAALEAPFQIEDIEIGVDASIGVVHSEAHGRDVNTLLRRADIAMYVAKARNLGTFAYDPAADGHSPAKVALLADLRRALDRDELELEVTESAIMTEPVRATELLNQLADRGIRISIDDFGVGYTSLGQLKNLPVSELKIDRSFVMSMADDRSNALIVRSVVDLGHALGLILVAEGVENEEILARLADLGCDIAQGYHLSRPVPAAAFDAWCADHPLAAPRAPGGPPGRREPTGQGGARLSEIPRQTVRSSSRL